MSRPATTLARRGVRSLRRRALAVLFSLLPSLAAPALAAAQCQPSPPTPPASPSWEGVSSPGTEPPDTHGAAGPQGILSVTNLRIAYYSKSGSLLWIAHFSSFFSLGAVGELNFYTDPRAIYDPQSGRFYVALPKQVKALRGSEWVKSGGGSHWRPRQMRSQAILS